MSTQRAVSVASVVALPVIAVALISALPLLGQQPRPQQNDRPPMDRPPRWEYRVVPLPLKAEGAGAEQMSKPLNALSAEGGWDYVEKLGNKGDTVFLLFRRLPPPDGRGRPAEGRPPPREER